MRSDSPFDFANELIAGLGPRYEASMASAFSASMAALPALKVEVFRVTLSPRALAKMPFSTPTSAVAWVMLGK